MEAMQPRRKILPPVWVRALISLGLIALVASQLELDTAADRLSGGNLAWFLAAVGALLLALAVGAVRWLLFLEAAGIREGLGPTVRVYAIGAFCANFLPTAFGGDAVRAWLAGSRGTRVRAAVTVVVDRATLLLAAVAFAWLALAANSSAVPAMLVAALAAATGLVTAATLAAALAIRVSGRLKGWAPPRLRPVFAEIAGSVRACLRGRALIWRTSLLGLLYEGLTVVALWLLAESIALDVPFSVLAVTVPLVLLLTTIPVSIAGLGVREGGYVLMLHQAGVSATDATLLSLLSTVLFAIATAPGAFAMLVRSRRVPEAWHADNSSSSPPTHAVLP